MNELILEISALAISIFCLWDCFAHRRKLYWPMPNTWKEKIRDQHFIYVMQLVTLSASAFFSILEAGVERYAPVKNAVILFTLSEGYFLAHVVMSFLFTLYILNMSGASKEHGRKFFLAFFTPFFFSEFMVIINPFTKMIFYVDQNGAYRRGDFIWLLYVIATVYIVLGVIFFLMYKKRLSVMDRKAAFILISIAILGICIQGIWFITVELFFESICFLGFMMLLEDPAQQLGSGKTGRISQGFVVVISMIFIAVIAININLIYQTGSEQTGRIGTIQLDNIKGNLQETISGAEGNLLRFTMGMEQFINESKDMEEIETYIRDQKSYLYDLTGGNCYNVYAAAPDWTIIPDFDMPEHYHAVERVWYLGAKKNAGRIYISEPYIDAATGNLCFTLSNLLSDGDVVTAMDFTLSRVQDSVAQMSEDASQIAMIATKEGTIVGSTDLEAQGKKVSEAYPEYEEVFERVKASNEHRSFSMKISGKNYIVFSNETSNEWQLILGVESDAFYSEIYHQMVMLGAIDLLMVAVIVVFYLVSVNNQKKAENAMVATEGFISNLSEKLKSPVNDIVRISDRTLREEQNSQDALRDIREYGKRLQETMENLFSYSSILKSRVKEESEKGKKRGKEASASSRYIRNGIIGILVAALLTGLFLSIGTATKWGNSRIGREADKYHAELNRWILQQQSILGMFTNVIIADPSVLDDYDQAVKWLNDIAQNYNELSVCYMANPYNTEHSVIMNNGWVPEPDYHVEERQWYLDTERSGDGYSISAPYYDSQTGLYCITFSQIVYSKDGEFLGIFAIDCYIEKLIQVLDDSYSEDGYAFLVDQDGTILNHPYKNYEMGDGSITNIEDTEYAEAYHNGSLFGMRDYDGRYVSCRAQRSSISGFTVMVVQNWWSVYGTVMLVALVFLIMLVASIIAVAAMISRFIQWQEVANKKLVEAAEEAVSAGKAKSRFLAQMSHEIRTPINAVLGMNEMILRESEDASIQEYAGNIQSAGKNLLGLINTILDFSKIEEGKMEILPVRYDTATMIDNVALSIAGRAKDKGLIFETHVDEMLPTALYGDDMRISQVIMNLLTNAVKYTKEGRVDFYVTAAKKDEETIRLGIRVKDTGIGIKSEDIGKLFESFTRLEEDRNRTIEGTGLGMSIVHRLLTMMGSKLDIQSEYGKGSEFSFELDQTVVDSTPIGNFKQKAKAAAEKRENEPHLYAPKARVLAVDDNEMNLKVIKNLLKIFGIKPELASSGDEALKKLSESQFDIVLLDHMMPGMDGIETLRRARENGVIPAETKVIALTANAVVGAREGYLAAGFDDYLSKPVEIKLLEKILKKYLPTDVVEVRQKADAAEENMKKTGSEKKAEGARKVESAKKAEGARTSNQKTVADERIESGKNMAGAQSATLERDEINLEQDEASLEGDDEIFEFAPEGDELMEFLPEGEGESKVETSEDVLKRIQQEGILTEEGLSYCAGDQEFYLEMLSDYADSEKNREEELNAAFAAKDWNAYAIKVHALKSVAKTVGDAKVFEGAKSLEMAAKEEREKEILEKHPLLMQEYARKADFLHDLL
ncbi:MAG: response regulator [Lachnospiraceae bacterium]|nr:response regulator [Lachnospiraceae bacterium]